MARYVDADNFRQGLIDRQITTQFFNPRERHEIGCIIEMLDNAPTADVAPKSEVAREIFAEIEKECQWYCDAYKWSSLADSVVKQISQSIAELKKKYIGE